MITILIVDDNERKTEKINDVVCDALLRQPKRVLIARNLHDAAGIVEHHLVDLLILDLHIPFRRGKDPKENGGVEFLRQLRDRRIDGLPGEIVGLTEFAPLKDKFDSEFRDEMWYLIIYEEGSDGWADSLTRKCVQLAVRKTGKRDRYDVDLAIVTALRPVELEAVLALK